MYGLIRISTVFPYLIKVVLEYNRNMISIFFLNGRFHYLVCFDLALKRINYLSVVMLIYKADSCYIELIENNTVTLFLLRYLVIHIVKLIVKEIVCL